MEACQGWIEIPLSSRTDNDNNLNGLSERKDMGEKGRLYVSYPDDMTTVEHPILIPK